MNKYFAYSIHDNNVYYILLNEYIISKFILKNFHVVMSKRRESASKTNVNNNLIERR